MGKSKKRIFNKNSDSKGSILKRSKIVEKIIFDIRANNLSDETKKFISLFGISLEELSEAGANYEELSAVRHLII